MAVLGRFHAAGCGLGWTQVRGVALVRLALLGAVAEVLVTRYVTSRGARPRPPRMAGAKVTISATVAGNQAVGVAVRSGVAVGVGVAVPLGRVGEIHDRVDA